jgi:hypothetical protein
MDDRMNRSVKTVGLFLLLAWAAAFPSPAAEPEKLEKSPAPAIGGDGDRKPFDGLGFSEAPKGGGKARTAMFGLVAEGYKFVYVFDRSGSMGGDGSASLRAVKAELLRSLTNLDTVHQFQVIFYNERPVAYNPTGAAGRLCFATDENKNAVERFLDTIKADGGTDHLAALRMATSLHPDAIFFLTDGDDPVLAPAELDKVARWAAGVIVHTIEFGPGEAKEKNNFLKDLARRTGGEYAYVNSSKLGEKENDTGKKSP